MTSRRRISAGIGAVAAFVLAVPLAPASASGGPYAAFADADVLRVAVSNASFPLGLVVQAPGPDATVSADSLGTSDATASFPYLGSGVQGLPGLAAGLFQFPIPPYPLQATTNAGHAPVDNNGPGYALHAQSGDSRTTAVATGGTTAAGATATSSIEQRADGSIVVTADSELNAVELGGILQLKGVESQVVLTSSPDTGTIDRTASLTIGGISAPGLSFTIPKSTPGQVPIPVPIPGLGQLPVLKFPPVPIPFGGMTIDAPQIGFRDGTFTISLPGLGDKQFAVPAAPVIAAFKKLGVGITIEKAKKTTTGATAPALDMKYVLPIPPSQQLPSKTHAQMTIGGAVASLDLHPAGALPTVTPSTPSPPSQVAPVAPVSVPPQSSAPVSQPVLPPVSTTSPVAQPPAVAAQPAAVQLAFAAHLLYPVLVAVAFVGFAAMHYLRLKGVRSPWAS
jgi:hypothetical protein